MISYLVIGFSDQAIIDYNIPNLFDLVGLAFIATGLKVENLGDATAEEDTVTTFDALFESEKLEQLHHP
jgi:hypothetical protein